MNSINMIAPIIALVGRPNVGKSTLFNYLTCTRDALVTNFPGQTRDRKYGCIKIKNHKFICIDTGGIDEIEDGIEACVIEQSLIAIKEADVVLLLVDAQVGLMPADIAIAKHLHCNKKITFLVANKIDGIDINQVIVDFWTLGLGNVHPITASYGHGVASLMKKIFLLFSNTTTSLSIVNEEVKYWSQSKIYSTKNKKYNNNFSSLKLPIKIAIIGRRNVGKSTLTNCILGKKRVVVHDTPGTTRDSIYIPMQHNNDEYILIDTAGIHKRSKITTLSEKFSIIRTIEAIKDANVVMLVIDASKCISNQDLSLLNFILYSGRSLLIVINKWDSLNQKVKERVKKTINYSMNFVHFTRIHFISALYGNGVNNLFKSIHESYSNATKQLSTSTLTRIMTMAVKNHQPPLVLGRRIKLKYAHAGGYNPPLIVFHGKHVRYLTKSYKRYLVNYFHKSLNLIGTPIHIQFKETNNSSINKDRLPIQNQLRKRTFRKYKHK